MKNRIISLFLSLLVERPLLSENRDFMAKRKYKKRKWLRNSNRIPGEAVYLGSKGHLETTYELLSYDSDQIAVTQSSSLEKLWSSWGHKKINWLIVNGLNNEAELKKIRDRFAIHPLVMEDIANTGQRLKLDEYPKYIFLVLKMPVGENISYKQEHLSFILGDSFLLSFQETEHELFEKIKSRLKNKIGQVRQRKADYLLYAILDIVLSNYIAITDELGLALEELEDRVFKGETDEEVTQEIQKLKPSILNIRRISFSLREITKKLEKAEPGLIEQGSFNYFRDLNDLALEVSENIELYRDMLVSLMEMYISAINNRMSEVMKVLTIIATIFIPLTFIAGIYGMNFENMPELKLKHGYYYVLGLMLLVILMMLWFFKRRKWL